MGLGWILLDTEGAQDGLLALVVPSTFCTLWAVTSIRAHRLGVRGYRVGYAAVAVVSVLSILFGLLPFSATMGAVTLLGAGFLILGWRERSQPVWITAIVGIVVGSATSGQPVRQILGVTVNPVSSLISVLVTAGFAVIVLAVGAWMFLAESREMKNRDR
ncbi:hypothetical protein [Rhodococcus jostii]|uniref:hypothetical protein n=1 Tax=Rhodococcus jostii TaxID=132919 RepID=UPI003651C3EC